ncbi:MAG: hypothetical protein EBR82_12205 [Caulobacteraceae bacterium]|nr:hypothetical protein [Caulobacteraceae bacterium]
MKGKPGLAILLGSPKGGEEDESSEKEYDQHTEDLAQELIDALKDEDPKGVAAAIHAMVIACMDEESDEDEES